MFWEWNTVRPKRFLRNHLQDDLSSLPSWDKIFEYPMYLILKLLQTVVFTITFWIKLVAARVYKTRTGPNSWCTIEREI